MIFFYTYNHSQFLIRYIILISIFSIIYELPTTTFIKYIVTIFVFIVLDKYLTVVEKKYEILKNDHTTNFKIVYQMTDIHPDIILFKK